jgi:hypothetical protein
MNDNSNVSINDDDAMKPERKKLRMSDPDLKISVGANGEAVEYWYHSIIMANHSNYIDTMLATPMKESKTFELSFPDIAPPTWDSMMKFLEGPVAVRLMTAKDAMEMAPLYDQYDFHQGRELCDQVLKEYFQDKIKILSDLNCFVDAVLLADAANLNEAKNLGVEWLGQTLGQTLEAYSPQNGGFIFTEEHIRKLTPLIIKADVLFQIVRHSFSYFSGYYIKSKDDLRSPLFPSALVMLYEKVETRRVLRGEFFHIMLSGTGCKADGFCTSNNPIGNTYDCCGTAGLWDGVQVNFEVNRLEDDAGWAIIAATLPEIDEDGERNYDNVVSKTLWCCPNSHSLPLPPQDGWIPVHKLAIGRQPTVSHRMDDGRPWSTDLGTMLGLE